MRNLKKKFDAKLKMEERAISQKIELQNLTVVKIILLVLKKIFLSFFQKINWKTLERFNFLKRLD